MRKTILKIAAAAGCVLLAAQADAAPRRTEPGWQTYAGLGYQGASLGHGSSGGADVPTNLTDGINAHIGERFGRYWGVELGWSRNNAEDNGGTATTAPYQRKTSVAGPTLDLNGYLPIMGDRFSLVGTVGGSYFKINTTNTGAASAFHLEKSQLGGRVGGGFEFRPMRYFSVDAIARYQTADFDGVAKGGMVYSLGLNFYI